MPYMGEIAIGDQIKVSLRADSGNLGSTAIGTGYVPDGVHPPPPSEFDMVAPAGVVTQYTRVRPAYALKITVDVPPGGSGMLEVFVNGTKRDSGVVNDTIWTYGIP